MNRRLELAANVSVLTACLVLSGVVIDRYVILRSVVHRDFGLDVRPPETLISGAVPELDFRGAELTALVIVESSCRFCIDGAPFYRAILKVSERKALGTFQVMFVGTKGADDARKFMTDQGIGSPAVRAGTLPASLADKVVGTPIMLLVGRDGVIQHSYVGKLEKATQAAVLAKIGAN